MKLLVVTESLLERVGAVYYAVDTWIRFPQFLAAHGAEVTVWVPVRTASAAPAGSWPVDLGGLTVEPHDPYRSYAAYYRLWPRRVLAWRGRAARLTAAHDVVMLRLPSPMLRLITRAARRASTPLVLMVAGDSLAQSDRIQASRGLRRVLYERATRYLVGQERRCARHAAIVYAYSEELAARHRAGGAPVRRFRTPHLSVRDIVKRDDTCQAPEVRILRACWLVPSKGLECLLDAMAVLRSRGRRVRLEVVGQERGSGYTERLLARARQLGVADVVALSGWVPFDRIREVYLRSDVQVISSLAEGTPRCIVEGAAHGVPLVSTTAGGCLDVLEHERTALLVPPGEAAAIAGAVERVIDDGRLRRALIAHGYGMARAATFEAVGPGFLDELRSLVREGRSAPVALG